jgi:hypothetical protein
MTAAVPLASFLGFLIPHVVASSTATCPVTITQTTPFTEPLHASPTQFWFGSESLAVLINTSGKWQGMGADHHYRNKLFWWRRGYNGAIEQRPALTVTGRRINGEAATARASRATNAHSRDFGGWAILVMMEFPAAGCWEVTGNYHADQLSFIVEVGAS